jgi:predicted NAD-dependent protein-ADP-ribosyltransferase YbiA (DUF1768 family)
MAKFKTERLKMYRQENIGSYQDLDGMKLSDLIDMLKELQEKHSVDARFGIEVDSDYGCNSGYTSVNVNVSSTHLETDEEYKKRHEQWQAIEKAKREHAKQNRQLREEQDRKMFERLSRKYGK